MADPSCIFCRIVDGEVPATFVHQDEQVVAIQDLNPQAPTHVLLMPRRHIVSAGDLTQADGPLLGRLLEVSAQIARTRGIAEGGYRIVSNIGPDGGQTVPHLHFHLLGGRRFTWPPG